MLKISDILITDQGLIALLKAVPNLGSLEFVEHFRDEEDSYEDDEEDSSESGEDGNDDFEGDGHDDNDAYSVECEINHYNEDEGDVSNFAECNNKDEGEGNDDNDNDSWPLDIVTTGCLFPHLESVCFRQFVGNPRELRWVKLILRNSKALQMMTIRYFNTVLRFVNAKSEKELMIEIPSFPRASAGCVFKFCS